MNGYCASIFVRQVLRWEFLEYTYILRKNEERKHAFDVEVRLEKKARNQLRKKVKKFDHAIDQEKFFLLYKFPPLYIVISN